MKIAESSRPVRKIAANGGGHAFTVVEMSITLVVIGLILGAVLVPLGARLREQKYTEVRAQLVQIKEAIVTYTESSRTAPFVYKHGIDGRTQYFAGGRHYLPCPDINGDGIENRRFGIYSQNIADLGIEFGLLGVTVSRTQVVAGGTNRNAASLLTLTFNSNVTLNDLSPQRNPDPDGQLPAGFCESDIGLVPHSTLGTPPADPWGNRFTYRVDPIFSNDILGFGPETRADTLDPRLPLASTGEYKQRSNSYSPNSKFFIDNLPVMICVDPNFNPDRDDRSCEFSKIPDSSSSARYFLGARGGDPALSVEDHGLGRSALRLYKDNDLRAAGAFVVVSHGENGFGGFPHIFGKNIKGQVKSLLPRVPGQTISNRNLMLCNPPPVSLLELSNTVSKFLCETAKKDEKALRHGFYKLPRSHTPESEFDDELAYMSGSELSGKMTRRGISLGPVWVPPKEQ